MIDYDNILKEATQTKFKIIQQKKNNDYGCEYSEGEGCSLCTHPRWCILDNDRWEIEKEKNYLKLKINELEMCISDCNRLMKKYPEKELNELTNKDIKTLRFELNDYKQQLRDLRKKELQIRKSKSVKVDGSIGFNFR